MRLVFFLLLAVVFFAPLGSGVPVDALRAVVLTSLVLLLMGLTSELPSSYLVQGIYAEPGKRDRWARLLRLLRRLHLGIAIGIYLTTLLICHWPVVVRVNWHLADTLFLDEVVILLPFVVGLLFSWSSFYRVERALHLSSNETMQEAMPTMREFLKMRARHHLAILLEPLLVFAAIQSAIQCYEAGWPWWLIPCYAMVCLLAIAWFLPWVWTKAWETTPLPVGHCRSQLELLCRRMGTPLTNLLHWDTDHQHAMAMLVGYLPRPRFVILSDLLIEQLSEDELAAVLAHELGHVKQRHLWVMLSYVLFSLVLWTLACWLVLTAVKSLAFLDQLLIQVALLALMAIYVRLTLCDLSRYLEREADLVACLAWHDESPGYGLAVYAHALHKVAQLNGESPDHVSWLHGSVTERTEHLSRVLDDPLARLHFSRVMLGVKTGLVAALVSLTLWLGYAWHQL